MTDIIHLLSDAVANQIAAGEVIQRPSSVVKELVENALDSGASSIDIIIKAAGKTLIQVNDNGCGMTETDARMCFERHATSKINKTNDLFAIRTMGFRGEAMASIASVSQVLLKTRTHDTETGTKIEIHASEIISQEPVALSTGTQTAVKNLFYNVPARRKFLKSDTTEFRHIVEELIRIALPNPDIRFRLYHNDEEIYHLEKDHQRQRIISLFNKQINQYLISVHTETSLINIDGFVGKPEKAKKRVGEQYFFVNGRYMHHPYFRRAVIMAFEKLIPQGTYPSYFLFLEIDPSAIDINIHPTKTEIKFENERVLFQIINAAVKEALGKFSILPAMDFQENETKDVHFTSKTSFNPPQVEIDPEFNPFDTSSKKHTSNKSYIPEKSHVPKNWQDLYAPLSEEKESIDNEQSNSQTSMLSSEPDMHKFFQLKNKYILTAAKSGLMVIDQSRARERILYEDLLEKMQTHQGVTQKQLFPRQLQITAKERSLLLEMMEELVNIGFNISMLGNDSISINGIPANLADDKGELLLEDMLKIFVEESGTIELAFHEHLALALSRASSKNFNRKLEQEEMQSLFYKLMNCSVHKFSPSGKKILEILPVGDFEKLLK